MRKMVLFTLFVSLVFCGCSKSGHFVFPQKVTVFYAKRDSSRCYNYAVAELVRLLNRINIDVKTTRRSIKNNCFEIRLSTSDKIAKAADVLPPKLMQDAYRLKITDKDITISSSSAKGVLNGVYDLAERLGYLFLLPGRDGEWQPLKDQLKTLPVGNFIENPRFPFRGVFWQGFNEKDFTNEEWLRFYAKLRFNALSHNIEDLPLAQELGLRLEVGGHGLSKLLPRNNFAKHPEWFRMVQPYDFNGKRVNDFNFCATNQEARKIIKENFRKELQGLKGAHAVHAWPDDLPGGGWCLCPTCRSFTPRDQAMLAMRDLAEVVAEEKLPIRIPVLAYHDTMFPGLQIDAPKQSFLLFAPRERCYGHALDDPSCPRNRYYLKALKAWMKKFKGIDDAHTFEYYFDQILFRGMHPFLPLVILGDMSVYQKAGIECYMSLQVAGPDIAPEQNMLIFSKALWDEHLTPETFIENMADRICPTQPQPWIEFYTRRAQIFANAMRMCDHNLDIYLDYRWLAGTTRPFGREMAQAYEKSSIELAEIAAKLERAVKPSWPQRVSDLAEKETGRALFEAAELHVMHLQQKAMNRFATFLNSRDPKEAEQGVSLLEQAISAQKQAYKKARESGLPENSWYFGGINQWLKKEFEIKIANYKEPGKTPSQKTK